MSSEIVRPRCEADPARTVAVLPHPDDEVFLAGSLVAWGAQIVCATRGEAGVDRSEGGSGAAVGDLRWAELEASCAALGLEPPVGLGLRDGGVSASEVAEAAAPWLVGADRVVTLGRDGMYGHFDHLAVTAGVLDVADIVHLAVFPRGVFHPVWRGLRRAGFVGVKPGMHPEDFGVDEPELRVPSPGRWRLVAAACHRSQLRGAPEDFLRPGLLASLGDEDWFEVRR